jgi:hypothetical protein
MSRRHSIDATISASEDPRHHCRERSHFVCKHMETKQGIQMIGRTAAAAACALHLIASGLSPEEART